jgi:hypothetical protein
MDPGAQSPRKIIGNRWEQSHKKLPISRRYAIPKLRRAERAVGHHHTRISIIGLQAALCLRQKEHLLTVAITVQCAEKCSKVCQKAFLSQKSELIRTTRDVMRSIQPYRPGSQLRLYHRKFQLQRRSIRRHVHIFILSI